MQWFISLLIQLRMTNLFSAHESVFVEKNTKSLFMWEICPLVKHFNELIENRHESKHETEIGGVFVICEPQ